MAAVLVREDVAISVRAMPPGANSRVVLRCHLDTLTGYGQTGIALTREWQRLGLDVALVPLATWEPSGHPLPPDARRLLSETVDDPWELLLSPPEHSGTPGAACVHLTMWESNRLPRAAVGILNAKQAVIVPSRWNQLSFDAAGVETPIYQVPLGYDPAVFTPRPPRRQERFRFGSAGRMAHGGMRKGLRAVLETFQATFPRDGDVRLSLKVFPDDDFPAVHDQRVEVVRQAFTDAEMADWYGSLDCYVSLAAAEGFGLCPLQAMACGRPVIATQATGHAEYFAPACGYVLPCDLVQAQGEAPGNRYYHGYWFRPDMHAACVSMRAAYEDREGAEKRGREAAYRARSYSWERTAAGIIAVLRGVGALA